MHRAVAAAPERHTTPAYRPPIGVPTRRQGRWGLVASLLLHALLILLVLGPLLRPKPPVVSKLAGGTGPAGGGGGGRLGLSPQHAGPEGIRYVRVAPVAPPVATPPVRPPTPVVKPVVKPTVKQPVVTAQQPVVPPASVAPQSAAPSVVAIAPSTGAGTDGTNGAGPGTGGGEGTGTGPGRGAGTGPGTGGGVGTVFPATPDFAVIPPLPVPKHLHGKTVELRFTVDATGRVVSFDFDSTGDSGYDRQLKERLGEYHFRPAHKGDGTPVASVFVTQVVL